MIMATCRIRANRHITLLNQQDVTGLIRLWQRRNKPHSPLYMQVRLKGFKVNTDNETTNCENGTLNETETTTTANYVRFGMHVHESGDLSRDCQSTGNHFNPQSTTHGGPNDIVKHTGDLGNISCDGRGVATENLVFNHLSLVGENSILNRAIVVSKQLTLTVHSIHCCFHSRFETNQTTMGRIRKYWPHREFELPAVLSVNWSTLIISVILSPIPPHRNL